MTSRFPLPMMTLCGSLLLAGQAHTAPVSSINLLNNPSFESDLAGWTAVAGTTAPTSYGAALVPSIAMGAHIGGGNKVLRDSSGGAIIEQTISVGVVPAGTNVKASGFFGGGNTGSSRLVLRYLAAGGGELGLSQLEYVTREDRNLETVLMYREGTFAIPPGTVSIAARVEFGYACCVTPQGAVDALDVELVTTSLTPAPLPMNSELLVNRDFESGWTNGSPLTLVDAQGWRGVQALAAVVKPYSDVDANVPNTLVSCLIGGGLPGSSCVPGGAGNLLSDLNGGAVLRQRLDVRGNTASFATPGAVALRAAAFLGGVGADVDSARIDVRFLNASNVTISPLTPIGPVTREQRNSQTVLLYRQQEFLVPPTTSYIEVDIAFGYSCCSAAQGLIDNVSAMLVAPSTVAPIPLGVNLVRNGGFEDGSLGGSPLTLADSKGWYGLNASAVEVLNYGSSASVPDVTFAADRGLGGAVLSDLGGAGSIQQTIDLRGSQADVNAGVLRATASCWLGGVGSDVDSAEVRIQFANAAGVQVGGSGGFVILPAVTAADRGNATTMLPRNQDFPIPSGAARMTVTVQFNYSCCSNADGLADGISVVAYNTVTPSTLAFCLGDGSGSTCPCGNQSPVGANAGCRGSLGVGGKLDSTGVASMSADTLVLTGAQMPNGPALYFQGTAQSFGGLGNSFGDGLRCATGTIIRLATKANAGNASQYPSGSDPAVSVRGLITSPGIRTYQVWYRDSAAFCTSSTFNLTNGWQVTWAF